MYRWSWLADVLRGTGLKVIEEPGWKSAGHGDAGEALGIVCHHDACGAPGDMPEVELVIDEHGRPGLPGPICNLALGRDGTWYAIAAGRAWHAGVGDGWYDIDDGNLNCIGIEAKNKGDGTEPWPQAQLDSYHRGCAAMLDHMKRPTAMAFGHKEWTARKIDPYPLDMDEFRADVDKYRKLHIPNPPESENE